MHADWGTVLARVKTQFMVISGTAMVPDPRAAEGRLHIQPQRGTQVLEGKGLTGTPTAKKINDRLLGLLLCSGAGGKVCEVLTYVLLDGTGMASEPFPLPALILNSSAQAADSRVLGAGGWV